MAQCDSGNGLTEDGRGLCLRTATRQVEETRGGRVTIHNMCRGCAGHWTLMHPTTMVLIEEAS